MEARLSRQRHIQILVCDDEPNFARLLQAFLAEYGIVVTASQDGRDAVALVKERQYNLVILDVMLPGMSGLDVLRAIRADTSVQETPVILISARAQDADVFEGYHAGCDMYLTKPLNPRELLPLFGIRP